MKSSFGRKLFWLFLVFSLVPAVLLTVSGYYLTVGFGELTVSPSSQSRSQLAGYLNDYLFDQIEQSLVIASEDSPASTELDFYFQTDGDTVIFPINRVPLTTPDALAMVQRSRTSPRGFAQIDGAVVQYVALGYPDGPTVVGGISHRGDYASLWEDVQSEEAEHNSLRELTIRYAYFAAVVLLVLAASSGLFAYLFSSRLSRNLARPLVEMGEASQKIAAGDFEQQVRLQGSGEVRLMIENFNQMASRLKETTARLTQAERVAAWRNVARRFAHELKNPLQPIAISLHRIKTRLQDSPDYAALQEPLQAASEELKQLTALAERFSELAKMPPSSPRDVDLVELLSSLSSLYADQLAAHDFHLDLPTEPCHVSIDATYFREAIHNLLKNAIEASAPGGRITLGLRTNEGSVSIVIDDEGTGMDKETLKAARMPYFTTKETGNGIGLAVVEKVVNEHGGSLDIETEPGKGCRVTIVLPLSSGENDAT
ncbi:MAG: HAMP domain-containing protein [candidate division Zixibacteria bacterium]|nr:HAMP domain-containing protein [candidate division Zixibacteria bacterium]